MDQGMVIDLAQRSLMVIVEVSAPILGISLVIGLAVSIFQATTQIQEQTMTFIPKILSVVAAVTFFGSWMLKTLLEFTLGIYTNINMYIR